MNTTILEYRESISLDPDDVDYLYAWAQQAYVKVKELERSNDEMLEALKAIDFETEDPHADTRTLAELHGQLLRIRNIAITMIAKAEANQ